MTILSLARFQFAMTTVYHFFFVPFSIGTAFIVAIMESMYVSTKDETYKKMAKFWGNIFLLSFAVGMLFASQTFLYVRPAWVLARR